MYRIGARRSTSSLRWRAVDRDRGHESGCNDRADRAHCHPHHRAGDEAPGDPGHPPDGDRRHRRGAAGADRSPRAGRGRREGAADHGTLQAGLVRAEARAERGQGAGPGGRRPSGRRHRGPVLGRGRGADRLAGPQAQGTGRHRPARRGVQAAGPAPTASRVTRSWASRCWPRPAPRPGWRSSPR